MRATSIFGFAKPAGGKVDHLSFHACYSAPKGICWVGEIDIALFLLSQGWAEVADDVTEAPYVEAVASAQSKKIGIWGDGSL